MPEKRKRKSKQKNQANNSVFLGIMFVLVIAFLLGIGAVFLYNYESNLQLQNTAIRLQENPTRQSQIEESATAAIHNETATAEANVTVTP